MDIFQIAGIGIVGAVLAVTLKHYKPPLAVAVGLATGIVLFFKIVGVIDDVMGRFSEIVAKSGLDNQYFFIVTKIIGTAYLSQFAAQLCRDSGEGAIAMKIELAGKIMILAMTMPILMGFLNICIEILEIL